MLYELENLGGDKVTVDCRDDGTVVYTSGKRQTKFPLADCSEFVFSFSDRTSHKVVLGEDGVDQLLLIVLHGEKRLERNNNDRETDGQLRLGAMNDKRAQELADLTVGDVKLYDEDTSTIYLTGKWSKTRAVPLSIPSFNLLRQYIQVMGLTNAKTPLFVNRNGERLTRHGISLIVKKYAQKAKFDCPSLASKTITPHTLRHSKAMHMLQGGIDLIKIRDLLGHESISTTEIYAKTHDTDLRLAMTGANNNLKELASWHNNPGIMSRLASYARKTK